jgi:hypothetical protein
MPDTVSLDVGSVEAWGDAAHQNTLSRMRLGRLCACRAISAIVHQAIGSQAKSILVKVLVEVASPKRGFDAKRAG